MYQESLAERIVNEFEDQYPHVRYEIDFNTMTPYIDVPDDLQDIIDKHEVEIIGIYAVGHNGGPATDERQAYELEDGSVILIKDEDDKDEIEVDWYDSMRQMRRLSSMPRGRVTVTEY